MIMREHLCYWKEAGWVDARHAQQHATGGQQDCTDCRMSCLSWSAEIFWPSGRLMGQSTSAFKPKPYLAVPSSPA